MDLMTKFQETLFQVARSNIELPPDVVELLAESFVDDELNDARARLDKARGQADAHMELVKVAKRQAAGDVDDASKFSRSDSEVRRLETIHERFTAAVLRAASDVEAVEAGSDGRKLAWIADWQTRADEVLAKYQTHRQKLIDKWLPEIVRADYLQNKIERCVHGLHSKEFQRISATTAAAAVV